jgi:hypothetical protein
MDFILCMAASSGFTVGSIAICCTVSSRCALQLSLDNSDSCDALFCSDAAFVSSSFFTAEGSTAAAAAARSLSSSNSARSCGSRST